MRLLEKTLVPSLMQAWLSSSRGVGADCGGRELKDRKINITGGNKIDDCRALVKDLFDARERDYPNFGEYYEKIVRVSVVEE